MKGDRGDATAPEAGPPRSTVRSSMELLVTIHASLSPALTPVSPFGPMMTTTPVVSPAIFAASVASASFKNGPQCGVVHVEGCVLGDCPSRLDHGFARKRAPTHPASTIGDHDHQRVVAFEDLGSVLGVPPVGGEHAPVGVGSVHVLWHQHQGSLPSSLNRSSRPRPLLRQSAARLPAGCALEQVACPRLGATDLRPRRVAGLPESARVRGDQGASRTPRPSS